MKKTVFIIFIALFFSTSLFAKASSLELVDEYLEVSGTKEIILTLPKQIEKGYLASIHNKNLKTIDIKNSFNSKQTIKHFKNQLSQQLSDDMLKKIITFYNTPLGKKFKTNSIVAMEQKNHKKKTLFFEEIGKDLPSYHRLNVMNAFVDRLELTPITVHLIGELLGSINAQLLTSSDKEKVFYSISKQIRDYMLITSLYVYSDFTDKELKNIMGYYYTNAGRSEQKIVSGIFKQFIMESFSIILEQSQQKTANSDLYTSH